VRVPFLAEMRKKKKNQAYQVNEKTYIERDEPPQAGEKQTEGCGDTITC
jgi:hypothetical protein